MTARADTVVSVHNLTRTYARRRKHARTALDGVSFEIRAGEWTALLGPNGAGKSTLLRILATLDAPGAGSATVLGAEVGRAGRSDLTAARARLGVVFQTPGLDPLLTVRENMRAQAALHVVPASVREALIDKYARACGISDRLDDRVGNLSGGLARRADLARALLPEPDLLLLDEPTAGLDLAARRAFLDTLTAAARTDRPVTILMNTHAMDEAERADRVIMLDEGRLVADGSPADLRTELGGTLMRTGAAARETLAQAGLEVTDTDDRLVATGDRDRIERAAHDLLRSNTPFEVGPPTLGDVYLARTGRALGEAAS